MHIADMLIFFCFLFLLSKKAFGFPVFKAIIFLGKICVDYIFLRVPWE